MSVEYHELVTDDDGHWYVIPCNMRDTFDDWVSSATDGTEDFDPDLFSDRRVDGPHEVVFEGWLRRNL